MQRFCATFLFSFLTGLLAAQQDTVFATDSSTIEIRYYRKSRVYPFNCKLVDERLNGRNVIHQLIYDTQVPPVLRSDGYTDSTGYRDFGIRKLYGETGRLEKIIDYDKRMWSLVDAARYPHYALLNRMKGKADSIVQATYSREFFEEHLKWEINVSFFFCNTYKFPHSPFRWYELDTGNVNPPTEFSIEYQLQHDGEIRPYSIRVLIDLKGELLKCFIWERWIATNWGLEKLEKDSSRNFTLTHVQAIEAAKQLGLQETDSAKATCYLQWEGTPGFFPEPVSGHWRMYVLQKTYSETYKEIYPRRNRFFHLYKPAVFIQYYNLWIFNPWTGAFVEKKTVHRQHETNRMSEITGCVTAYMNGKR